MFVSIQDQTIWPKYPLAAFEGNGEPFKKNFVAKNVDCSLLADQSIIQKNTARWNFLHYRQRDHELAIVNFRLFSHLSSEGICQAKLGFVFEYRLETLLFLDEMYWWT